MTSAHESITDRVEKNQQSLCEQLKKVPIVQVACEKTGIGRSTYYRWRKEDAEFARLSDDALVLGRSFINDLAESHLLKAIQNNDLTAIIFWLKYNHKQYGNRLELTAKIKSDSSPMTEEQEEMVRKALEFASLTASSEVTESNHGS